MYVKILQYLSAKTFSKQLLDIGDGKVPIFKITGRIKLPNDFCTIINLQNYLIDQLIHPDIWQKKQQKMWMSTI